MECVELEIPPYCAGYIGKRVHVQVDRPLGSHHPSHGFYYPVNYGCLPGVLAPDGDELDAYVLEVDEPLAEFDGVCIAVIHRLDDEDDKLVVVPEGVEMSNEDITALTAFQEQFFHSVVLR